MEYLVDKYIKTPDYVKELFQEHVLVTLKIDGSAFQIFYNKDEDKLEYHKRGGSSSKLGPIIDEYTQLFTKHLNDAIDFFDGKKDILKKYKFYAIEIFDDMYVLLNVIDNNDKVVNDIFEIARELNIEPLPTLFGGKIDFKDIEPLLLLDGKTTNKEFTDLLKNTFGPGDYLKFLNGDEVEGIVLTWIKDDKPLQYKIINPAFKTRHEKEQNDKLKEAEKDTEQLNKLIKLLYDRLSDVAKYRNDNWIKNLDLNFFEMCSDPNWLQDVKNIAKEITPNNNKWFMLQLNRISNIIKKLLDDNGDEMKTIYEKYLMTFNKPKKRAFIISKEFQTNINNIIEKLQSVKESLRLYTKINMKSLNNYINESYEQINEGKNFTLQDCKGWKFSFIGIKNKYGLRDEPKMKFSLVCTPDDKTKDIVVFRNFASYHGGYDQGHASSRKFYLDTITSGGRGNGHGQDKEYEPRDYDLKIDAEHLDCYLNGKKDWSTQAAESLEKAAKTYDRKTKISQIKNDLL